MISLTSLYFSQLLLNCAFDSHGLHPTCSLSSEHVRLYYTEIIDNRWIIDIDRKILGYFILKGWGTGKLTQFPNLLV